MTNEYARELEIAERYNSTIKTVPLGDAVATELVGADPNRITVALGYNDLVGGSSLAVYSYGVMRNGAMITLGSVNANSPVVKLTFTELGELIREPIIGFAPVESIVATVATLTRVR